MAEPYKERREDGRESLSGLSEDEAREFHRYFLLSAGGFGVVALIAHILTYIVIPWGPNT